MSLTVNVAVCFIIIPFIHQHIGRLWIPRRLRSVSVSGSGVIGRGVSGGGISGSSRFNPPLSLVVNIHLILRLDLEGALAATEASVAASTAASDDGNSRPIPILFPCGGSGGNRTGTGDSDGAAVRDAYISPFSEVSSEKPSPELHLRFLHRVKSRLKLMQKLLSMI